MPAAVASASSGTVCLVYLCSQPGPHFKVNATQPDPGSEEPEKLKSSEVPLMRKRTHTYDCKTGHRALGRGLECKV